MRTRCSWYEGLGAVPSGDIISIAAHTQNTSMLLSLHIDQQAPNHYTARILDHQTEVDEFFAEDTQSAITLSGQEGYGTMGFHIWYWVVHRHRRLEDN